MKKLYRCNICNDIHFGNSPPKNCPTCFAENAYVEIEKREAANIQEIKTEQTNRITNQISKENLIQVWKNWTQKTTFKLNPDSWHVETVAQGVLKNEKQFRLKLCPCRLRDGKRERDLELICPCNFFTHKTWSEKGQCWCGLFVKK